MAVEPEHRAWPPTSVEVRYGLGRFLWGQGLEIGPGHNPFPIPNDGVSVRYVDKWWPAENSVMFPELVDAAFPEPDIVADLDRDRLRAVADATVDFVIASHVLEHLAEPIGMLADIERVVRPGGVAIVLLPDRRRTFDHTRQPTDLEHLVREFEAGIDTVDDAHIEEFLTGTGVQLADGDDRVEQIEHHRRRTVHVHCWHEVEFIEVIDHCIRHMGHRWEFLDGAVALDQGPPGHEFGWVMRKRPLDHVSSATLADRFVGAWSDWYSHRSALNGLVETLIVERQRIDALGGQEHLAGLRSQTEHLRAEVDRLTGELAATRARRSVRLVDRLARWVPRR